MNELKRAEVIVIHGTYGSPDGNWFFVLHGENDPYVPASRAQQLAEHLHTKVTTIPDGKHLNAEAGWTTLPLLVQLIKSCLASID